MKITDFPAATSVNDSDLFLIDGDNGTKTITGAVLKQSINSAMSGGYTYCGYNDVTLSFGSVGAQSLSSKKSITFTDTTGATVFIPVSTGYSWTIVTGIDVSKSGTTVTVSGWGANFGNTEHSGVGNIRVHKFKAV